MKTTKLVFAALIAVLLVACNTNDKQTVGFYLTDAPANKDILAVNVDVQAIKYSISSEEGEDAWIDLPMSPVVINLLDFSNGKDTLLSNIELETGVKIHQVRLILGDNNTVMLSDSSILPIQTPSAQQSGLKLNVQSNSEVTSGYKVVIDFDASRSIVLKGNGEYLLKPVIRAYITANSSRIYGNLLPADVATRVFTTDINGDTIATVSDTLQNNLFVLHGLYSGTYDIMVENLTTGETGVLKEDVSVTGGVNINLGELVIPLME
jgi:hypothetical protein